jgi:signal transduction histidine kinase
VTAVSHLAQKTDAFEELVAEGQVRRSDLDKFLAVCRDSAEITLLNLRRAAELVASFKRVAVDQSSEERRTFKVKEYLHEILLSLRPKLKHANFSVQVHCDEKLELDHYPGTFSQIITNLVVNTLMHGYLDDERGLVTITMERVKDRYLLRYADDGKGIEPQHIGRIFDPFFTTRRGQGVAKAVRARAQSLPSNFRLRGKKRPHDGYAKWFRPLPGVCRRFRRGDRGG